MAKLPKHYVDQAFQFGYESGRIGPEGIIRVRSLLDQEGARFRRETGFLAACSRGCAHCCRRPVKATFPEILQLLSVVQSHPEIENRIRAYVERMTPAFERLAPMQPLDCPFLEPDSRTCRVYEQRPLFCRGWSSSDVSACQTYAEDPDSPPPPLSEEESHLCDVLTQGLVLGIASAGAPSGLYELASAILIVLDAQRNGGGTPADLERVKVLSEQALSAPGMNPAVRAAAESPSAARFKALYLEESDWAGARAILKGQSPVEAIQRMAFPRVHESEDEIDAWFADWLEAVEAFSAGRWDPREAYESLVIHDTFALAYSGRSVKPYLERHGQVITDLARRVAPELCDPLPARNPGKPRIGFISGRLQDFNGSRWAIGWLKTRSPEVETYCFNLADAEDAGSQAFRRLSDHYFHVPFPALEVARHIRSLDLDLLVWTDIGMGGPEYQLAPLRLARKQATAWGHPVTSGLPSIDWYLSSEWMEPADADTEYTERLIRLPGSGLAYPPLTGQPSSATRASFGLSEGPLILSCQNPMKYLARFDRLYAEVSDRAGAEIVFVGGLYKGDLRKLKARFQRAGVRAKWLLQLPTRDYLRLIQLADVVLDSPAWNGGNTTIEALSAGKPVVALPTQFMRGRHSLAFLRQAGVGDLLAESESDYVELALGTDRQRSAMANLAAENLFLDKRPMAEIERLVWENLG